MPWIKDFPLSRLLVNPHYSYLRYGIGVEQAGYTPNDLGSESFLQTDHPFAATLMLKNFLIATDTVHRQRFATTLSLGIIGPDALADKIQDAVHTFIHDVVPGGWKYQVQNDIIANYQVDYQKQLLSLNNILLLDAEGTARAGTLNDKAGAGIDLVAGIFQSPFGNDVADPCLHFYLYDNPEVDVIGYDATLQGGLFDHSSAYTIPAADISRVTFTNRVGAIMSYKHIRLEYDECTLTKQFTTGPCHLWGTISLGILLNNRKQAD